MVPAFDSCSTKVPWMFDSLRSSITLLERSIFFSIAILFHFSLPIKRFHNSTDLVLQDSGCLHFQCFSFRKANLSSQATLHKERLKFLCENFQFSIFYLLDFHKANKKQSSSLNLLPLWKAINRKHWKNTWSGKKKKNSRRQGYEGITMNSCS